MEKIGHSHHPINQLKIAPLTFFNRAVDPLADAELERLVQLELDTGKQLDQGRTREALALWERENARLGRIPIVFKNLARIHASMGRFGPAALNAFASTEADWAGDFISSLMAKAGQGDQFTLQFFLCCNMCRQARWPESERAARELARMAPRSPDIRVLLCGILLELGQETEALACYHEAGRLGLQGYVGSHCRMASILPAQQMPESANAEYAKVFESSRFECLGVSCSTPESYVIHARDTTLIPDNFSLLMSDGRTLVHDGLDTNSRGSMIMLPHHRILTSADKVLLDLPPVTQEIREECVLLGGGPNFSHCINDWCSKLFVWEAFPQKKDLPILVSRLVPPQILEWLDILGYPGHRLLWLEPGVTYRLENVWVPSLSHAFQLVAPRYLEHVRSKARLVSGEHRPGLRLYFSRSSARVRRVANEAEMVDFLRARGFELIIPERYSMKSQLDMLAHAEVLVMPTGGASAAGLFLPSGSLLVELQNSCQYLQQYRVVCELAGIRHDALHGQLVESQGAPLRFDQDFSVDVRKLAAVLDRHGIT